MLNNEQIGVSAEIAIADIFRVMVDNNYRSRGVQKITDSIMPIVQDIFTSKNIPTPTKHVAGGQSKTDFILSDGKTLSVKTNKQKLGKAAPQIVGQASSKTWFNILAEKLNIKDVPESYPERVELFKTTAIKNIAKLLQIYWDYMFSCDFLIHIFNVVDAKDKPTDNPNYIVMKKTSSPIWDKTKITFTKSNANEWNESNTVKYDGVTIGEFQVHNNRDNFKFRFNMTGLSTLMSEGKLNFS